MTDEFETSIEKTRKIILHKYTGDEPNVILPDGINIIGNQAFSNNSKLISLIISEGVTEICKGSFENCSNLSSIFIPESVATIESGAFQNCNNLKSVIISSEGLNICPGMFSSNPQIRIYFPHKTIPFSFFTDGLFERQTLFDHSNKLIENLLGFAKANYPLEPKLMKLCEYGMINNLSQYDSLVFAMNSIVIWKVYIAICRLEYPIELNEEYRKKYIYYLKNNADLFMPEFINDGDIESISILAENMAIPQDKIDTFIEQAIELSQVEILAVLMNHKHETWGMSYEVSLELESKPESDWETLENWDDTLTIRKYVGNNSDVIIPATLNGKQVSRIEGILGSLNVSVFFHERSRVQTVIIEEGIIEIGDRAFIECENLESVLIPDSVTRIGRQAFTGCIMLKAINLPEHIAEIGPGAFEDCSSLTSIVIPEGLLKIGGLAFSGCTSLTFIIILESVKKIGWGAFDDCDNLVIHAPKGSYAIEYAKAKNVKFMET